MRKARSREGTLLFQAEDYLSPKQITSFFSRLSKKSVLNAPDIVSQEEEGEGRFDHEQKNVYSHLNHYIVPCDLIVP